MRNILRLIVLATLPALSAQDCPRLVPVNVFSYRTHEPLPFPPERLQAIIAGNPLKISGFEKAKGNRFLILVDISESMKQASVKELVESLLDQFPLESSFAYGFFNDNVLLSDGFRDSSELKKALAQMPSLEIKGPTHLYDALDQAIKLFGNPAPGDSILVISDGHDNRSKVRVNAIQKELLESSIRVFAIMPTLPAGPDGSTPIYGGPPESLSDLAKQSGGTVYPLDINGPRWSVKQWRGSVFKSIQNFWVNGVGGSYRVTIMVPRSLVKPTVWKLRLGKSGDKLPEEGVVTYPEKLMPCSNAAAAVH